ncbi:hypothetical protein E4U55_004238 [Claviceps digitariae]|nr:hypothetical protein E4U55_004238 [Claviceps digitariae]
MTPIKTVSNALVKVEGPIDLFFRRYSNFDYNPQAEAWTEFYRMCGYFGWYGNNKKQAKARGVFREAIVAQFGAQYGTDENKLDILQGLCEKLEISPIPLSITACKKAVKSVHVNIMDFIDCERTGNPIHKFASVNQLRRYTIAHRKFFPKNEAKKSPLLRYLLRTFFSR